MNYDARGRPGFYSASWCVLLLWTRRGEGRSGGGWTYVYCRRYYYFLQLLQRGIQSRKFQFAAR